MTTYPEDAMTRERALREAARLADEWNWRNFSENKRPCPVDFRSGLGDAIRALSVAQQEPAPPADSGLQTCRDHFVRHPSEPDK